MEESQRMKEKIQGITGSLIFNTAFDKVESGEMRKALEYLNTQLLKLFEENKIIECPDQGCENCEMLRNQA